MALVVTQGLLLTGMLGVDTATAQGHPRFAVRVAPKWRAVLPHCQALRFRSGHKGRGFPIAADALHSGV